MSSLPDLRKAQWQRLKDHAQLGDVYRAYASDRTVDIVQQGDQVVCRFWAEEEEKTCTVSVREYLGAIEPQDGERETKNAAKEHFARNNRRVGCFGLSRYDQ